MIDHADPDDENSELPEFLRGPFDLEDRLHEWCSASGPHIVGHAYCVKCGDVSMHAAPLIRRMHLSGGLRPVFGLDGLPCGISSCSGTIRSLPSKREQFSWDIEADFDSAG